MGIESHNAALTAQNNQHGFGFCNKEGSRNCSRPDPVCTKRARSTSANFDFGLLFFFEFGQFDFGQFRLWPVGRSRIVRSRIGRSRASSTRHNCPHLEQPHCNPCRHKRDTTGRDHGNSGAHEHHNTVNETTRLPSGTHGKQSRHQMTFSPVPPLEEDQTNVYCVAQEHHLLASPNRHPNCEEIATLSTQNVPIREKILIVALSQNGCIQYDKCTRRNCSELTYYPAVKDRWDGVLSDLEQLGGKEFLVLTSQYTVVIFSCCLRTLPYFIRPMSREFSNSCGRSF